MKNILHILKREFLSRVKNRTFILMSIIGPLLIIGIIATAIFYGNEGKNKAKVVVSDPDGVLAFLESDDFVEFELIHEDIPMEEFESSPQYKGYDILCIMPDNIDMKSFAMVYKELPSIQIQKRILRSITGQVESYIAKKYYDLSPSDYYKIIQQWKFDPIPLNNPIEVQQQKEAAWVGIGFSSIIFFFILFFGSQLMFSVLNEKRNRVVEILLSSVSARQLMLGKIGGVALAGILQTIIWFTIILASIFIFKTQVFTDIYDPSQIVETQMSAEVQMEASAQALNLQQNSIAQLIFHSIDWMTMLPIFLFYFITGFILYAGIFAAIGAASRHESDAFQLILPAIIPVLLGLVISGITAFNPANSGLAWSSIFPLTSPTTTLTHFAIGYQEGSSYEFYLSMLLLLIFAIISIVFNARIFRNGILRWQTKTSVKDLFKWLKRDI